MTPPVPKAFISWSSGKDSAFALLEARRLGFADIVGVLTTISEVHDRVSMHGVRNALLDRQIAALNLPCLKVSLPNPCSNETYERRMAAAIARIKSAGVNHIVFGDLFLDDVRAYREEKLAAADMTGIFPLWRRDTLSLAKEMIARALSLISLRSIRESLIAVSPDAPTITILAALPSGVDPCGKNGEFHTFVSSCPMFRGADPDHDRPDRRKRQFHLRRCRTTGSIRAQFYGNGFGCLLRRPEMG